jgi:3-deoxy-7-phosphoheptulonate synthase
MEGVEDPNPAPLAAPRAVKERMPPTPRAAEVVQQARSAVRDLLHGRDRRRLLMVVGPCSIHDAGAALDYARRLACIAEETRDVLVVLMRTYFEKPRTTIGWKGLINDPRLDGSCDVAAGLERARAILLDINQLGLPCAAELLDPFTPPYVADLLSWVAVGARTSESQPHREMASGLPMPVGFKNGTDGGLERARNAMIAAGHPHTFVGIDDGGAASVVRTRGNPDRHVVLRGGMSGPNFSPADVARAADLVADQGVTRPILVDCAHDNSAKDHTRQAEVCRSVVSQVLAGQGALLGLLIESSLRPGSQPWAPGRPLTYGISITDPCIGWEETEALLLATAQALRGATEARTGGTPSLSTAAATAPSA